MTERAHEPGQVLSGRYRLDEEIGQGGAGRVFRAHDGRLDRAVAVKVLTDLGDSAVTRFRREAATAARIQHPNVVTLHDAGVDGAPYLVMSLVDGPSLAERVDAEGPLGEAELRRLARDLFEGLDATHRAGVMHRDLTPRNVLFDRDGMALLADFGIARGPDDPTVTAPHTIMGTRPFVAPERLRGADATPTTDVYAVGVTLRYAVTGTHTDPMPDGHPFAPLVAACTAEDPARRPTSAEAALALLPPDPNEHALARSPETEPLPSSVVTPPVQRAPGADRTVGPSTEPRPVPATSSRSRPLAVVGVLATLVVAAALASSAVRTPADPTKPAGEAATDQVATDDGAGTAPAPAFDPTSPGDSARQLADWVRARDG